MLLSKKHRKAEAIILQCALVFAVKYLRKKKPPSHGTRFGKPARVRKRVSVEDIYTCLGDNYFSRAYRMSYCSFRCLHNRLKDNIGKSIKDAAILRKRARRQQQRWYRRRGAGNKYPIVPPPPNGDITISVRLACALRYFAGGSPYDIMTNYGISHSETLDSVWYVVDAVNRTREFDISYPESAGEQQKIASEFKRISSVNFSNCGGALDGILIWMLKSSLADAKRAGVDQQKFFCGRKNKYGLNCQAVCDARGKFLDISIVYGGSSSDLLAFEKSALKQRLDRGLLAETKLVLFSDNAYINSSYMVTPYPNTSGGARDNYNFFQSQVRITIECAFGKLVQRWGLLRMAMPRGITIQKTIALVLTLSKLHNFCIEMTDEESATTLHQDEQNITTNEHGSVPLVPNNEAGANTPDDLIGGGEHFNDVPRDSRRPDETDEQRRALVRQVIDSHLTRPRRYGR